MESTVNQKRLFGCAPAISSLEIDEQVIMCQCNGKVKNASTQSRDVIHRYVKTRPVIEFYLKQKWTIH